MTTFTKNPYFIIFKRFDYFTAFIPKVLLYNNKIKFFTPISKSVITYITIAVTNILNNITKQFYVIIKTFKVLLIVRKKQFSRTNILI